MCASIPAGEKKLTTVNDWDEKWSHIFDHYQQDLRHAYYIRAVKERNEQRLLEMAAGSFRDTIALCNWGLDCHGMDFSPGAVKMAKERFPKFAEKLHVMDALKTTFPDKAFDLTYHNGFWVLFPDEMILSLAQEQARITRHRMIATVHNAHNTQFKEYFARKQLEDSLYNIRFFEVEQIKRLMGTVCSRVSVIPVGKAKRAGEDRLINSGHGHPLILRAYFRLSGMRRLNQSERLLCIGTL